jgi:hypothetical protein
MNQADRVRLLHGPYLPPVCRRGDLLFCEIRGTVKVGGYSTAPIPWPRLLKTGRPALILCGDLVRAVKIESELAVAHHWGVGVTTVWAWRKTLGVGRITEGTERLYRDYKPDKFTDDRTAAGRESARKPESIGKMRSAKIGKPMHPTTAAALLKAASRNKRKAHRQAIGESHRRSHFLQWAAHRPEDWPELERDALEAIRIAPAPSRGRWWLKEEEALLGKAPDSIVAALLGRTKASVTLHRSSLGISPFEFGDWVAETLKGTP